MPCRDARSAELRPPGSPVNSGPRPCHFDVAFPLSGFQDRIHTSDLNVRARHAPLALRARYDHRRATGIVRGTVVYRHQRKRSPCLRLREAGPLLTAAAAGWSATGGLRALELRSPAENEIEREAVLAFADARRRYEEGFSPDTPAERVAAVPRVARSTTTSGPKPMTRSAPRRSCAS